MTITNTNSTSDKARRLLWLLVPFLFFLGSCKKFLDKKIDDSYTETEVYAKESTIQQALNGIYASLSGNEIYGKELSMGAVEVLALRYNVQYGSPYQDAFKSVNEGVAPADSSILSGVWVSVYATILKVNKFIEQMKLLQGNTDILSEAHRTQMLGEAIGIRALLHFEMMRLFGPDDIAGTGPAVPYYSLPAATARPVLSSVAIADSILVDLNKAEELLADDPIKTTGVNITPNSIDFYSSYRNRRINYYAIKGFQARLNMYVGNREAAHDAALAALEGETWFPWLEPDDILGNPDPNRVFSPEVMFGVQNPGLYSIYNAEFTNVTDVSGLLPRPYYVDAVFQSNTNDLRYLTTWSVGNGVELFFKYAQPLSTSKEWAYFIPVLRKTEMYYILAETDDDEEAAFAYLNTVRENRGLSELDPSADDLITEIGNEYVKEFFGEGQVLYYYKRTAPDEILSGAIDDDFAYRDNGDFGNFRVPLPLIEIQSR